MVNTAICHFIRIELESTLLKLLISHYYSILTSKHTEVDLSKTSLPVKANQGSKIAPIHQLEPFKTLDSFHMSEWKVN